MAAAQASFFALLRFLSPRFLCAGQRSFLGVITISKLRYLISSFLRRRSDDYERLSAVPFSVWENEDDQKFYSVTFARTHMDGANKYHDTDSFGRDDLPLVAKLADQAHTFIFERLAELKTNQSE